MYVLSYLRKWTGKYIGIRHVTLARRWLYTMLALARRLHDSMALFLPAWCSRARGINSSRLIISERASSRAIIMARSPTRSKWPTYIYEWANTCECICDASVAVGLLHFLPTYSVLGSSAAANPDVLCQERGKSATDDRAVDMRAIESAALLLAG